MIKDKPHNKLIFFSLLSSLLFCNYSYAQTSKPTVFKNGIASGSAIKSTDGTTQAILTPNVAGGVAGLDNNGRVIATVVGDVSGATATTDGKTVSQIGQMAEGAVQANGGDASKTVVTPTGDTASHALSDVAAQATGSVQKTSIGVANGVAPLDDNEMMSAPVSGAIGSSTYTNQSGGTARTLGSRLAERYTPTDFGVTMTGVSSDQAALSNVFTSNSADRTVHVPSGTWPSGFTPANGTGQGATHMVESESGTNNAPSYVYTPSDMPIHQIYTLNFGDGVAAFGKNTLGTGGVQMSRVDRTNSYGSYRPVAQVNIVADGDTDIGDTSIPGARAFSINGIYTKNWAVHNKSGAATQAIDSFVEGNQGYNAFVVGSYNRMHEFGQHWAWNQINEMNDFSRSYACLSSGGSCTHVNVEFDQGGVGPDTAASAYDPTQHTRTNVRITTNDYITGSTWTASTSYNSHDIVQVQDAAGQSWLYESGAAGSSGSTAPTWAFDATTNVADGTITWYPLGKYAFDVGVGLEFGGTSASRFGTLISADSSVNLYNAVMDFSKTSFSGSGPHVFARIQSDMRLDLTADGTASGQNNHLIGYDTTRKAFGFWVSGNFATGWRDNGDTLLPVRTKANLLAQTDAFEGETAYDSDDHAEVTYRCPTTSTCGWFPVQYGAALSN